MDSGSWWPDDDTSAGRIPLSALEHADYCLRQAALIHVDGVFADDEDHNQQGGSYCVTASYSSAGPSARRGSQRQPGLRGDVLLEQRWAFGPGEDHNHLGAAGVTCQRGRQRWAFGPGEDHNGDFSQFFVRLVGQRWAFGPGEDHNVLALDPKGEDTTAALGLRARRGSQLRGAPSGDRGPAEQRWVFGPGEDHNFEEGAHPSALLTQRWAFGPGEDHNWRKLGQAPDVEDAALGLRARRGSQPAVPAVQHGQVELAALGLRARRGSQQVDGGQPVGHAGGAALGLRARRGSQPSGVAHGRVDVGRSAGPSGPARITTRSACRPGCTTEQRWAFGPGEDHNCKTAAVNDAFRPVAAPGLRPRRGSQLQPARGFDFDANRRPNSREVPVGRPAERELLSEIMCGGQVRRGCCSRKAASGLSGIMRHYP